MSIRTSGRPYDRASKCQSVWTSKHPDARASGWPSGRELNKRQSVGLHFVDSSSQCSRPCRKMLQKLKKEEGGHNGTLIEASGRGFTLTPRCLWRLTHNTWKKGKKYFLYASIVCLFLIHHLLIVGSLSVRLFLSSFSTKKRRNDQTMKPCECDVSSFFVSCTWIEQMCLRVRYTVHPCKIYKSS